MSLKKKGKDNSNARECDEKSFLKENVTLMNQPSESANLWRKKKKRGIEREQWLRMRWLEFFFYKTWCLWSIHVNQQATDEGREKVLKKSWIVTLLVNVMIKKILKDKTWRYWSPARDRRWTHSTTHWQSRSSHSGKYQSSPSALCGSCKKNKAATARPDSYEFRRTTLGHPRQ